MSSWEDYADYRPEFREVAGTVKVLRDRRDLVVWLPPSYEGSSDAYPVLYLQDGQNLFDPDTAFAEEWRVDESMESLAREGLEAIVVGIPNAGSRRFDEYSPFRDPVQGGGAADSYLDLVIHWVKPVVEAEFRVQRGAASTGIGGSSMGGLFSLWALFERPDVFGFCAAMSPSLGFAAGGMLRYLHSAPWVDARIYLDGGTLEGVPAGRLAIRSRAYARRFVRRLRMARDLLVSLGWREGEDLLYVEERKGRHEEAAWARRFPSAARFFLEPLVRGHAGE